MVVVMDLVVEVVDMVAEGSKNSEEKGYSNLEFSNLELGIQRQSKYSLRINKAHIMFNVAAGSFISHSSFWQDENRTASRLDITFKTLPLGSFCLDLHILLPNAIPDQVPAAFLFNHLVSTSPKAACTEAEYFQNYLDHDVNQVASLTEDACDGLAANKLKQCTNKTYVKGEKQKVITELCALKSNRGLSHLPISSSSPGRGMWQVLYTRHNGGTLDVSRGTGPWRSRDTEKTMAILAS
ncbi:hypothetical protein Celaphus_00015700 [Cervus elaphus hippelaphus]|uniref:Uncharacterized protein n=1 Tax=Cervus elaphus hippelaphus TaxID=46360 RepID=A0A212C1X7_CEREH|nr:hypothetical protein Celaphus_00015700 [Cervus elaphus hippelaphus]